MLVPEPVTISDAVGSGVLPPGQPALLPGVVHVWTVSLDREPSSVSSLLDRLSGEERARAARLRTTQMRLRFIVAHGMLRTVLGRYLDVSPDGIHFDRLSEGKPFIPGLPLAFNLSHSDALAVIAVTREGQLGVDVERIRHVTDADRIAKRYFAPGEVQQYESLPPTDRATTFFCAWTRKEAFVKATGRGLQHPLHSFEVEVTPDAASPRVLRHDGTTTGASSFALRSFTPAMGYVAAVALDSAIEGLELFECGSGTSLT